MFNKIKYSIKYLKTKRQLGKLDPKNIKRFSFLGVEKYARIYKVYDGDTVSLLFRWKKQTINVSCRIDGIDTPELRTKNEKEKELAIKARDFLKDLILEKTLLVTFLKNGKYGRPLIEIHLPNGQSIKDIMIRKKYAKFYDGGSKKGLWKF